MVNQTTKDLLEKEFNEENIFNQMGLENLPEKEKDNLLTKMVDTVIARVSVIVMRRLKEEEQKKLEDLLKEGDDDKVIKFLREYVPDYDSLLYNETQALKSELVEAYKGILKEAEKQLKNKE